jgi:hypothetical protein
MKNIYDTYIKQSYTVKVILDGSICTLFKGEKNKVVIFMFDEDKYSEKNIEIINFNIVNSKEVRVVKLGRSEFEVLRKKL